jgi:hypothetical protein
MSDTHPHKKHSTFSKLQHFWRKMTVYPRRHWENVVWFSVPVLALLAIGFGWAGYHVRAMDPALQKTGAVPDAATVAYQIMQLFVFNGQNLDGAIPWQLHVARFLGVFPVLLGTTWAFLRYLPEEVSLLLMRLGVLRRNIVVICGFSDLSEYLAIDARRMRKKVILIDPDIPQASRQSLRARRVIAIDSDPRDPEILRHSFLLHAEKLLAASSDDAMNMAVAASAHELINKEGNPRRQYDCHILIANSSLRAQLNEELRLSYKPVGDREVGRCRIVMDDLDLPMIAARHALDEHPLEMTCHIGPQDTMVVHLIVVGCGLEGRALALHAAHIAHFANEINRRARFRLTVADCAEANMLAFEEQYPALREVCRYEHFLLPKNRKACQAALASRVASNELVTLAFTWTGSANDERNASDGFAARDYFRAHNVFVKDMQILVHQSSKKGAPDFVGQLLDDNKAAFALHFFGMKENCLKWGEVYSEELDRRARAIHEEYYKNYPYEDYVEWRHSSEDTRNANRHAAGHIDVKLRSLNLDATTLDPKRTRIEVFPENELELLAQMEHLRWSTEKMLAGWRAPKIGVEPNDTDRKNQINKNICAWGKLDPIEREKDFDQIRLIPDILKAEGKGIYRRKIPASADIEEKVSQTVQVTASL